MSLVEYENREGVATLTLNRPEALNALSPAMFVELREHIDRIGTQTGEIGCVSISGSESDFISRSRLTSFASMLWRSQPPLSGRDPGRH